MAPAEDFRVAALEREMAGHESRLRSLEIHVATYGEQIASLTREVHNLANVFEKRFDRLNARVDEDVRGIRRWLIGMMGSVIGGAIIVALSTGVHG